MNKINHNSAKRRPATKIEHPEHRLASGDSTQDPHLLAQRLQRLMQAVADVPSRRPAALTCDDLEATLEFYVDAEIRGEVVRTIFPGVWSHLKDCERCQVSHRLLLDALNQVSPPEPAAQTVPVPLPTFLQPVAGDAPWSKLLPPRMAGKPLTFGLIIRTQHFEKRLAAVAPAGVRGGDAPESNSTLILTDTLSLPDCNVLVKVRAQRQPDPKFLGIALSVTGSTPLPDPLKITLTWNHYAHTDLIHAGRYVLDRVPASAVAGEAALRIEFSADVNPD